MNRHCNLLLLVSLALSVTASGDESLGVNKVPMKKYTIDLDQSPQERWLPILSDFNSSVPIILKYYNDHVHVTKMEQSSLNKLLSSIDVYFGEYGLEMKAIADYFGIDLGIVVTLNLAYELRRFGGGHPNTTGDSSELSSPGAYTGDGIGCTSIVAQNEEGQVLHGRNLDWDIPDDARNLTVHADFIKAGEVLFTGVVTVGMVGVFTGISKQGGFTIAINERDLGGSPIYDGINGLLKKSLCPSHLARMVLTSSHSYVDALEKLKTKPIVAPVYYITAGSGFNEGAVLTRERDSCHEPWILGSPNSQTADWYLLETNYDQWKQPKPYDNRRGYGNKYMHNLGQKRAATVDGLTSVLSKWPILNNLTTYTSVMIPADFFIYSYNIYMNSTTPH